MRRAALSTATGILCLLAASPALAAPDGGAPAVAAPTQAMFPTDAGLSPTVQLANPTPPPFVPPVDFPKVILPGKEGQISDYVMKALTAAKLNSPDADIAIDKGVIRVKLARTAAGTVRTVVIGPPGVPPTEPGKPLGDNLVLLCTPDCSAEDVASLSSLAASLSSGRDAKLWTENKPKAPPVTRVTAATSPGGAPPSNPTLGSRRRGRLVFGIFAALVIVLALAFRRRGSPSA